MQNMEVSNELERIVLLSDHGGVSLAKNIYRYLKGKNLYGKLHEFNQDDLYLNRFNNGESEVRLKTNVGGRHIFVVKYFNTLQKRFPYDYDENTWLERPKPSDLVFDADKGYNELFAINDAIKRSGASSITNILMFMPYLRSDKKDRSGDPIISKVMAKLTESSGASGVMTIYPHFPQIQGFYDIRMNILSSRVIFADWIMDNYDPKDVALIATDGGSVNYVKKLAKDLHTPYGLVYKDRSNPGVVSESTILYGDSLEGKVVIICDDIIDTSGSLLNPARYAKEKGAREVIACIAHPVLSCNAKDMLLEEGIRLVTTDSILIPDIEKYPNIKVLSLGYLIAEAIECISSGEMTDDKLYDFKDFRKRKKNKGL